jgi:hypothetical protein
MHKLIELNDSFLNNTSEQLIARCLKDWRFLSHPLRDHHLEQVNTEYARKLLSMTNAKDFDSGRLLLQSFETSAGTWLCGIRKLTWDSSFFDFPIGRLEPFIHPHQVNISDEVLSTAVKLVRAATKLALDNNLEHLTASADPADAVTIYALEECGFRLKDTMNYHFFDLHKLTLQREKTVARPAREEDIAHLAEFTVRSFGNREYVTNRFNSDPQYPQSRVAEMYRAWIEKSVSGELADAVFVIDYEGLPIGYLTAILPTSEQIQLGIPFGDMGIGAVDPKNHGQGSFRILHKEVLLWFKEQGVRYAMTRTATTTSGVNKNCLRHGSTIACSPHTFHIDLRRHDTRI